MSTREFFVQRWEAEQAAFSKVLNALPEDRLDYRPHERSSSAGGLAWQLAEEQRHLAQFLDKGRVDFEIAPHPSKAEIIKGWDEATAAARKAFASMDDAKWSAKGEFAMGGNVVWSDTIGNMLWGYLFDMVHHRGQLSTYLRPMGGKVPSIYGPSADDMGG